MPIKRQLTDEEIKLLQQRGIDPQPYLGKEVTLLTDDEVAQQQQTTSPGAPEQMSMTSAIGKSLKQQAGGMAGAGAGAMLGPVAASYLLGPEVGIPVTIAAGVLGALGGGYTGQKAQEALEGEETQKRLEAEAAAAREQHPIATVAGDITASMLAAGASPSISNLPRAGKALMSLARGGKVALSAADEAAMSQLGREALSPEGNTLLAEAAKNKEALGHVAMNAAVMPAINTGVEFALSGELPTPGRLAADVAGGALFSGQNILGKSIGRLSNRGEPAPEPKQRNEWGQQTDIPELAPKEPVKTAWTELLPDNKTPKITDDYVKEAWKKLHPEPDTSKMDESQAYIAKSEHKRLMKTPISEMRKQLSQREADRQLAMSRIESVVEPKPEPTAKFVETKSKMPFVQPEGFETPEPPPVEVNPIEGTHLPTDETLGDTVALQKAEQTRLEVEKQNKEMAEKEAAQKKLDEASGKIEKANEEVNKPLGQAKIVPPGAATRLAQHWVEKFGKGNIQHAIADAQEAFDLHTNAGDVEGAKRFGDLLRELKRMKEEGGRAYAPKEESITTKQKILLRQFMDTAKEIQSRTKLGLRKVTAAEKSFIISWSNSSASWYPKGYVKKLHIPDITVYDPAGREKWLKTYGKDARRPFLKAGEETELDANEVLLPANNQSEALLMAEHLPPLPLHGNSFEMNPLSKLGKGETTIDEIKTFYEKMQRGENLIKTDISESVSRFMDAIRSPEQNIVNAPQQDLSARYNEIYQQIRQLASEGKTNTPEFKQLWAELEAVNNQNKGMVPTENIEAPDAMVTVNTGQNDVGTVPGSKWEAQQKEQGIETFPPKKVILGDTVGETVGGFHKSSMLYDLVNKLKFDKDALKVRIFVNDQQSGRSYYDSHDDVIHLSRGYNDETVLHEMLHAAIYKKVENELRTTLSSGERHLDKLTEYLNSGKDENVKQIIEAYLDTVNHLGFGEQLFSKFGLANRPRKVQQVLGADNYFLSNIHEFVSGALSNKKFAQTLNKIQTKQGSIWSRLVGAMKRLLGFDVQRGSILENILRPVEDLVEEPRRTWNQGPKTGEEGKVYAPDKDVKPISDDGLPESFKKTGVSSMPFFTSRVDMVAKEHNNPTGHYVTTALHRFHGYMDYLVGQIGNRLVEFTKPHSREEINKVYHYLHDIDNIGKSSIMLTDEERGLANEITKSLRDLREEQISSGPMVRTQLGKLRKAGIKEEGYMFNILDPEVAHEWTTNPNGEKAREYDRLYLEHMESHDIEPEEAQKTLRDYKNALGNRSWRDVEFNALRKAEGYGLPWGLVDQNFASAATRYGERAARDLSYFKYLQNDPIVRKALDLKDQEGNRMPGESYPQVESIGGSTSVDKAMRSVYGIDMPINKPLMATARTAGNIVMGVGTAARNLLTMPAIASTYARTGQLHLIGKAFMRMNESRARAFTSNATRANYYDFDAAGFVKDDPNPAIALMNKFSAMMRKYQGRDFSDKFEGEYYYSLGEMLATDNIARAQKGDVKARAYLQRFGDIVEGGPERLFKGEIKPDDVQRIAKRFVDATRGTYGAEGLPSYALEGELAPFVALSKFSIEKANTVYKDVWVPLTKGDYGPFLHYALGSLGVGIAIEKLNEMLSNKRGPDPTMSEVSASGNIADVGAKLVSLGQLSSFAGIVSDAAKASIQMLQGKEVRYNQPLSFPLYTLISDTIAGNMKDAVEAIHEGQDPIKVAGMLAVTMASQSVQTMRYIDANVIRPEEAERKEKFRDVRVFQQLEGKNAGPSIKSNQFADLDAKTFKRTGSADEAMKLLPGLVQKAIEDSNGDPFELRRQLTRLKQNNYQTMPSIDNMPLSFLRYIQHLKATQGEAAANARLNDYITQNALNRAKSSVVPSI